MLEDAEVELEKAGECTTQLRKTAEKGGSALRPLFQRKKTPLLPSAVSG